MKELDIVSFDSTPIHCYLWDEVDNPKGVIQISHGMCEHGGRYDELARMFNAHGYIALADDHRAHGKTETDENRGRHKGDIESDTVKDLVFIYNWLKEKYNLPQALLGHSYGSFLAQDFLQQGTDVRAVALCGTADMNGAQTALALLWPLELMCKDWRPSFVNKVTDLMFRPKYKGDTGESQWVTSDRERREQFNADPMANIAVSINFDWNMIKAFGKIYRSENIAKIHNDTHIGIFSGDMDPIGGNKSSKAKKLAKRYKDAGLENVELHIYEGARHELHNEVCRAEYFKDLIAFFDAAIVPAFK